MLTPRNEALAFRIWAARRQLPDATTAELAYTLSTTPERVREVARLKGWAIDEERKGSGVWIRNARRADKFRDLPFRPRLGEFV